jgi:tetratricopeptide (TPR) repeat protein
MTRAFTLGAGNDPRIPLLGNLVDLLTSLKQPSLARETARQMVKALEEHRWAESAWLRRDQSLVAMSLARVGRVAQATKIARKLLSEARANPGVLAESGEDNLPTAVALLGEEALQDLTALWQQALQLARPENRAAALSVLATALHKIGRPDRALECLRQAFDAARADGHSDAFFLFADATDIIAHHDRGLLLWQTYERLQKFRRMLLAARQAA